MKNKIWSFYYWAMIGYFVIALIILIVSHATWKDRQIALSNCGATGLDYYEAGCDQGADTPIFVQFISHYIYFDFIDYVEEGCWPKCDKSGIDFKRYIELRNYYPFLLVFVMTLIRWISIGKHIWQRP